MHKLTLAKRFLYMCLCVLVLLPCLHQTTMEERVTKHREIFMHNYVLSSFLHSYYPTIFNPLWITVSLIGQTLWKIALHQKSLLFQHMYVFLSYLTLVCWFHVYMWMACVWVEFCFPSGFCCLDNFVFWNSAMAMLYILFCRLCFASG